MLKLLIALLSLFICIEADNDYQATHQLEDIAEFHQLEKRLIHAESSGRNRAVSFKMAYGQYQITLALLNDYNQHHKKKFRLKDMFDYHKSRDVFTWQFWRLYYDKWPETNVQSRLVYVVNSWNMGRSNTYYNHKYNHTFLNKVIPNTWSNFVANHFFTKYKKIWVLIPFKSMTGDR